jgi:serine/threonine protein phosphatase PrpC
LEIERAEVSLLGHREENQDRCGIIVDEAAMLMIVIDGMGGHSDGALAAQTTLDLISGNFRETPKPVLDAPGFLHRVIGRAHDRLVHIGKSHSLDARPRATCAVCLAQDGNAFWGHVGDSRIYLIRNDSVFARTRDHSHVELLLREGLITEQEVHTHPMRNYVECCLGGDSVLPEMSISACYRLQPGDLLLSCSDGLWSGVGESDIAALGNVAEGELESALQRLAERAVDANRPYSDNTTIAAMRWLR